MKRVYECDMAKKGELLKIVEAEPYAQDSFARAGYKTKEGGIAGEDRGKFYLYLSADEAFLKKAEEKIKGVAARTKEDVEKRIIALIEKEEENATEGFGGIFG